MLFYNVTCCTNSFYLGIHVKHRITFKHHAEFGCYRHDIIEFTVYYMCTIKSTPVSRRRQKRQMKPLTSPSDLFVCVCVRVRACVCVCVCVEVFNYQRNIDWSKVFFLFKGGRGIKHGILLCIPSFNYCKLETRRVIHAVLPPSPPPLENCSSPILTLESVLENSTTYIE